jgi:hypothetical protein
MAGKINIQETSCSKLRAYLHYLQDGRRNRVSFPFRDKVHWDNGGWNVREEDIGSSPEFLYV